jgi:hypothetical protein
MLAATTVIEAALVAGALVVALVGALQYALIALLALAMHPGPRWSATFLLTAVVVLLLSRRDAPWVRPPT